MDNFPVCTHCGFTFGEYRLRGLLGCPHCYAGFGEALQADVAWLHQALVLDPADAEMELSQKSVSESSNPEMVSRWRQQIAEAVRSENYEEAARLKRLIGGSGPVGSEPSLGLA